MNTVFLAEILSAIIFFASLLYKRWILRGPKRIIPVDWPVVGMSISLFQNRNRIHEYLTDILRNTDGTFHIKGPWFSNMDLFTTCDLTNTHYMLSKNFTNYPKGRDYARIFDVLGEGIFNVDHKAWEDQRKTVQFLLGHRNFHPFVQDTTWKKVASGLLPVLDNVLEKRNEVDLQQVFQRFTFDATSILVLGHDPATLTVDFPDVPYEKAFGEAEQAVLYRHILPEFFWKFQKWLRIGKEKKLADAALAIDNFILHCVTLKNEELQRMEKGGECLDNHHDLLTSYIMDLDENASVFDKSLRDKVLSLLFAGRDTVSAALTWLFWLIATNPFEEYKIHREVSTLLNKKGEGNWRILDKEELKSMVYLHGAICEALRLYPPVPLQHKGPVQSDVLPSGHRLKKHTKSVLSFYSMGRMESIWGKDCLDFKPERWITEKGGIRHEPAYKFSAFNAGPRSCLGKEMTFMQMKIVAASIMFHYKIQLVEGQSICPSDSVILHMLNGLRVRVTRRSAT
ncbi:alkane hydroxylase MAH1-like [Daucus carota subsp. sativus]|nr:PREDICTED: alkane hydroxylase MAH1-like [Daucus carota subsp. sativus]